MMEEIYQYEKRLERLLDKVRKAGVSERNKEIIFAFKDECFASGLSTARVTKYVKYLMKLATWLGKDFDQANERDIKRLVATIEKSNYVEWTRGEIKLCLKRLFRWLKGSEDYPPEVKWIKITKKKRSKVKVPEQLLTEDEVKRMIQVAANPRDRAFVAVLYESGCRIGEMLSLRVKNITFDRYGAVIAVPHFCKTGMRRVRIISSVPYLTEWLNRHPDQGNPEAYLWQSREGTQLSYPRARHILSDLARKAGIGKRVFPHLFRHSRATHLANHLTEAQMKEYFGWVQDSEMASVYVHLSGRDVDKAILHMYGLEQDRSKQEQAMAPKSCPRCGETNPLTNAFCSRCGMPLDEKEALRLIQMDMQRRQADSVLDQMLQDPEFREVFIRKLQEFGAAGT